MIPNLNLDRSRSRRLLLAAIAIACLLAAQLSTQQHGVDHPFHKHSALCDAFQDFEHSAGPLLQSVVVVLVIPVDKVTCVTTTSPIPQRVTGPSRIRGPPSFLA